MFKKLFNIRLFQWIRYIRQQLQNQRQNRQLIGQDRQGNKYYQYYSYWGLPTRRQIRFKVDGNWDMQDLVYYKWLHHQQFDPPSESQKQLLYQRALEWDRKEQFMLQQFRQKRLQLQMRDKALAELEKQMLANTQLTDIKTKRNNHIENTNNNNQNKINNNLQNKIEQTK